MKNFATILLAFVVGFATLASAQRIPVGPGGRAGIAGRGENREMLAAMALCTGALGTMRSALPIYQGHRVKAMAATRDAIQLIRQGLQFNRNNRGSTGVDALSVPTADNEPLGRFTREQMQVAQLVGLAMLAVLIVTVVVADITRLDRKSVV